METPALTVIALAIATFEGKPGDRNWRNNNPTNLKFANQPHTTGQDPLGFAKFDTFEHGLEAGERQILLDMRRHPDLTIRDLVDLWAPPTDNNPNNANYARFIANLLGLSPTTRLERALQVV